MIEAELKSLYDQAVKGLVLKGMYQQAIQPLTRLVESQAQHRYIVGNSAFWLGMCYRKLNQPIKARQAFQQVTAKNSYKYEEAQQYLNE